MLCFVNLRPLLLRIRSRHQFSSPEKNWLPLRDSNPRSSEGKFKGHICDPGVILYYSIAYTNLAEEDGEVATDEAQYGEEGDGEEIALPDAGEETLQETPIE